MPSCTASRFGGLKNRRDTLEGWVLRSVSFPFPADEELPRDSGNGLSLENRENGGGGVASRVTLPLFIAQEEVRAEDNDNDVV
jgi:hypothetical protein